MRILVVEDEPDLRRVLAQSLREDGYAVDAAADGQEGLFKATGTEYDAVVLDIMMPKMNGWEVLRNLRRTRATPVLILSARDQLADRVKGLDGGADDYLAKPFELAELGARLRALIRRCAGNSTPQIRVGELVIDTRAKGVFRNDQPVNLTAREYSLVEFLAVHRGVLVTRTMLYEHLYDEADDSLSNLIDVHIANVRRKLGKDFITTRRGQGYLIDPPAAQTVEE